MATTPKHFEDLVDRAINAMDAYMRSGDLAQLATAVAAWDAIVLASDFESAPPAFRLAALNDSGSALLRLYLGTTDTAALEAAVDRWTLAVARSEPSDPRLADRLNNLGTGFAQRYRVGNNLQDLDQAVDCFRRALRPVAGEPVLNLGFRSNLASALVDRYVAIGQPRDLDEALDVVGDALQQAPPGTPGRHYALITSGVIHEERYALYHRPGDLSSSVEAYEAALAELAPESPERLGVVTNLGAALHERYELAGDRADLDSAIEILDLAIKRHGVSGVDATGGLSNLAGARLDRFELDGAVEDLHAAIEVYEEVIERLPDAAPDRVRALNNLGMALVRRYSLYDRPSDLDRAVELLESATRQLVGSPTDAVMYISGLGVALHERYARDGTAADLDRAVDAFAQAVGRVGSGRDAPGYLANYATALLDRFSRSGEPNDVLAAVSAFQAAVDHTPSDATEWAARAMNLGLGLYARYELLGTLHDLDAAIDWLEQALQRTAPGAPERAKRLNALGVALHGRYGWSKDSRELDRASACFRDAAQTGLDTSVDRRGYLHNLGNTLRDRHGLDPTDAGLLAASRAAYEAAIRGCEVGSPNYMFYRSSLGLALFDSHIASGDRNALEQAIQIFVEVLPPDGEAEALAPSRHINLATALRRRFDIERHPEDAHRARQSYAAAAAAGATTAPADGLKAAKLMTEWALERHDWTAAAQAGQMAVSISRTLFEAQADRRGRQSWIQGTEGIAVSTALALSHIGRTAEAVEVLENGIARQLADTLRLIHADLSEIESGGHGPYAEAYRQAASRWTSAVQRGDRGAAVSARTSVAESIANIRRLPGHQAFLADATFAEIAAAAEVQPLVYLAAGTVGGFALAMERRASPVFLALDGATDRALGSQLLGSDQVPDVAGYLGAYVRWLAAPGDQGAAATWLAQLDDTLAWLWDAVMEPVVTWLREHGHSQATLVPVGRLALLPLHAALATPGAPQADRLYALDTVSLRYAPNARASLAAGRLAAQRDVGPGLLLLVADPERTDVAPLAHVAEEARAVLHHWRGSHKSLWAGSATAVAVRRAMPEADCIHFAGHGRAGWNHADTGGLLLADGEMLTITQLATLPLSARLVVLSACETSVPLLELPEEVIGLPTALLQAGGAGIVASLWPVGDRSTAALMDRFYELWQGSGHTPASALSRAQTWLRSQPSFAHPYHWAGFTLTGE